MIIIKYQNQIVNQLGFLYFCTVQWDHILIEDVIFQHVDEK